MSSDQTEPPRGPFEFYTADLMAPVAEIEPYALRQAPWQTFGLSLWLDHKGVSSLVLDDLPPSAAEDLETYVDEAEEEVRCLMAEAIRELRL